MGCPIRRSWDHRSLAAPPSLSQLATSFIAYCAKVSTCVLLCTFNFLRRKESALHLSTSRNLLEIAPTLCGRAAFHVWHMKVLHYTVFKDQRPRQRASSIAIVGLPQATTGTRIEARGRSLKAEQCSRYHTSSCTRSLSDDDLAIAVRHEVENFAPISSAQP